MTVSDSKISNDMEVAQPLSDSWASCRLRGCREGDNSCHDIGINLRVGARQVRCERSLNGQRTFISLSTCRSISHRCNEFTVSLGDSDLATRTDHVCNMSRFSRISWRSRLLIIRSMQRRKSQNTTTSQTQPSHCPCCCCCCCSCGLKARNPCRCRDTVLPASILTKFYCIC